MEAPEVMSLEDMDPWLRPGQVWKWKSRLTGHEGVYFLLDDVSEEADEIVWHALELSCGLTSYVYAVGQSSSWKRLV
jgi:hypothetical protein